MTNQDTSVVSGTNHATPSAVDFVFQEFKRVGSLITHVDQLLVSRQRRRSLEPQQTFTRFPCAFFGNRFFLRNRITTVQHLIAQPQHLTRLRIDGQTVLRDVASMVSVPDLPQVFQGSVRCKVHLRGVMQDQHGRRHLRDRFQSCLAMGSQDRLMRDVFAIHATILNISDNRQVYPDGEIPTYRKFELSLELSRTYDAPFAPFPVNLDAPDVEQVDQHGAKADLAGVTVEGLFRKPSDQVLRLPAFWDGAMWRIRMTPTEPGTWSYAIEVTDKQGEARTPWQSFTAAESQCPGFIRVVPGVPLFRFEDGSIFMPLGNNLQKTTDRQVIKTWSERLRTHGMNSQRIWLHPHYTALEWNAAGVRGPSFVPDALGLGRYCLRTADNMDYIVERAEQSGLYALLCQDDMICYENSPHEEPRIGWEYNPYREICANGMDFFRSELAKRYYKRRLRYMVARWAYSPHVFGWELQNEVDWPYLRVVYPDRGEAWKLTELVDWHNEMAAYLRGIDPYRRPVSTNTSSSPGGWGGGHRAGKYDDRFFLLHAGMDFANHHIYSQDSETLPKTAARFAQELPGKPLLLGEWGLDPHSKGDGQISVPIGLHNAIWMGVMNCAAAPYHWFWDTYYRVGGLRHCQVLSEFLDLPSFPSSQLTSRTLEVSGPVPLKAYGICTSRQILVWVWDPRSQQGRPVPDPIASAHVVLSGLVPGTYDAQYVDPWSGKCLGSHSLDFSSPTVRLELPVFSRDIALKFLSSEVPSGAIPLPTSPSE